MFNNNYLQNYQSNMINWVQGLEGAKAYPLTANSNVVLMDSENEGIFYIKVSDNIGMSNIRKFKYQEIIEPTKTENQYVTKEELKEILKELKDEQAISRTNTKYYTMNMMYNDYKEMFGDDTDRYIEISKLWLDDVDSDGGDIKTYRYATRV